MSVDVETLFNSQLQANQHFNKVFTELQNVKKRRIDVGKIYYELQYNPYRIGSSTANTEKKVSSDDCFLCEKHRFPGQIGIEYDENYNIFVNPFPIFRRHFTIVDKKHIPQDVTGELDTMVKLAEDLPNYTIFYNSRHSGASAPFHRHFQACETYELPVFQQIDTFISEYCVLCQKTDSNDEIYVIDDKTKIFHIIIGEDRKTFVSNLTKLLALIKYLLKTETPEANIGIIAKDNKYQAVVFIRTKHRPTEYFETGERHFTISPGFADMAGIIPCAIESEFYKLDENNIKSIFRQVSYFSADYKEFDLIKMKSMFN